MFGLDRKAVPRDLHLAYRNNRDHYLDLRGRPTRSRPLFHRDSALEVIPSRFEASSGAPIIADPGAGLLELVLDSAATMPVAAVDGEPVAVGDGRVLVALPAGRHVVEVQGGDTCSPVVVAIEEGRTASLFWREEADRHTRHFGPRETSTAIPKSLVYLYEWVAVVFVLCGLPVAVVNAFSVDSAGSVAAVVSVAVIGAILLAFLPWRKRERARVAELKLEGERPGCSEAVHYPWDGPAAPDRPALLGERFEIEVDAGEAAALRAESHVFVHREAGDQGEILADEGRLFMESEAFRVDWMDDPAERIEYWDTTI